MKRAQYHEGIHLQNFLDQVDPPFTNEIMQEEVTLNFKLLVMKLYDCSRDLVKHLDTFSIMDGAL